MDTKRYRELSKLLSQLPYYTKQNLSLVLNKDGYTLDYWIKKLIRSKILIPLKKGVYASDYYIQEIKTKGLYDLYLQQLANILCQPSYISLEYLLSYYDIIPETSYTITSITTKSTRVYKTDLASFSYRNIKTALFTGYRPKTSTNPIQKAAEAKALFDYLYFKRLANKTEVKQFLLETGRINWDRFLAKAENLKEFEFYAQLAGSKKMALVTQIIRSIKQKYG